MPETTRTFIAITIPEPLGWQLTALQAALASSIPECRWTSTLPFHATLAFLGEVENRDLEDLCKMTAASTAPLEPFELHLTGVGAFPNTHRPRVVWAGLTARDLAPLLELRTAIAQAVGQAGYPVDEAQFHAHVTLGRIKPHRGRARDLTGLVQQYRGWSGGGFRVDEVVTVASSLGPDGPSHRAIGQALLAGKKSRDSP
jgi:2'-5' RNA ligase